MRESAISVCESAKVLLFSEQHFRTSPSHFQSSYSKPHHIRPVDSQMVSSAEIHLIQHFKRVKIKLDFSKPHHIRTVDSQNVSSVEIHSTQHFNRVKSRVYTINFQGIFKLKKYNAAKLNIPSVTPALQRNCVGLMRSFD